MKKLEYYLGFILLICSLQLIGCAAMQPKIASYPLESMQARKFHVAKKDFSGADISEIEILTNISSQLEKSGNYNWQNKIPAEIGGLRGFNISGVKTSVNRDNPYSIKLQFYNGTYTPSQRFFLKMTNNWYTSAEKKDVSTLTADFNVTIENEKDSFDILLNYPQKVEENILWLQSNLAPTQNLINDIKTKFIQVNQPVIERVYELKGEVDSRYPSDSVYANFVRSLKKDSHTAKEDDIEKFGHFIISFHNQSISIRISVAPYRNGSKVKYEAIIPYKVSDNVSIDKTFIDELSKTIKSIVNS